jgi:hypothetical protein
MTSRPGAERRFAGQVADVLREAPEGAVDSPGEHCASASDHPVSTDVRDLHATMVHLCKTSVQDGAIVVA